MRESWLGQRPRHLSGNRNFELIIYLLKETQFTHSRSSKLRTRKLLLAFRRIPDLFQKRFYNSFYQTTQRKWRPHGDRNMAFSQSNYSFSMGYLKQNKTEKWKRFSAVYAVGNVWNTLTNSTWTLATKKTASINLIWSAVWSAVGKSEVIEFQNSSKLIWNCRL